jgi:hypothetical protein
VLVAHLAHAALSATGVPGTGVTRTGRRCHGPAGGLTLEA